LAALLANEEKELAKMKKPSAAQKKALQKDAVSSHTHTL
jgi:hypothetical protein